MRNLKYYIVINRPLVETLAWQIGLPIDQQKTVESQLGFTGKIGIGIKTSRSRQPLPTNNPRLLEPIVDYLRESGQLRVYPPVKADEFWRTPNEWYVYEETIATPVLIPVDHALTGSEHLPPAFTVWIVGQQSEARSMRRASNPDSFVFIIQELTTDRPDVLLGSPMSAFQKVIEVAAVLGRTPSLDNLAREKKVYYYDNWHQERPIEKLELLGGVKQRTRKIETVYKVAYMERTPSSIRPPDFADDVLAYPLYIVEV